MIRLRAATRRAKMSVGLSIAMIMLVTGTVLGSSYNSTIWYDTTLSGAVRWYDGQNIQISMNSHVDRAGSSQNFHTVQLYRRSCILWCGDALIGSKQIPREGFGSSRWTNVGSGNYWFYFYKSFDGVHVWSDNVWMRNN